ncbi:MAG: efflux RND transporter permease subunit [Hyphomonadaceae bacterium]|nr:efflux RND transporter permease subunit [Hyphomonadaceae bacterium]
MNGIVAFSIRNWRVTLGVMLFAVIGGIIAMGRLPLEAEPDIPIPFINVRVVLPGVSPEDSQRLLIRPMETEIKSVESLKQMDGIAANSVGYMILEFGFPFDQDIALRDVNEAVDRARSRFPQEAREPIVEEINTSSIPIVVVNLHGNAPERELQRLAKYLKRRIESIPSVLSANIAGERVEVLEAVIDPSRVESYGINLNEIATAVSGNNALITAGAIETETGRFGVKLPGLIENRQDLEELVVRRNDDGSVISIRDIADVRDGYRDAKSFARFNGNRSVSLEISKRQGGNVIETTRDVKRLVDEIYARPDWPDTVRMSYSQDRSEDVIEMVTSLFSSILNAVILVFLVCIVALGLRSALFVGWAVPASFLMALFMFMVQGETVNMMIMYGLILSVGVLIDSAIVIVEFADRKLAEGMGRVEAFRTAGERMFWPIISSTLTTLAAFIPFLFWESISGKYMSYFPRTMIYVLTASMLMAIIFLPTMGALFGPKTFDKKAANLQAISGGDSDPLATKGLLGFYVRLISMLIRFPALVIIGTLVSCYAIIQQFGASMSGDNPKPVEFFTQSAGSQVYILARARGNSTAKSDLDIALEIERRIAGIEGIKSVYAVTGNAAGGSGGGGSAMTGPQNVPTDTVAKIYTELEDFALRPPTEIIMDDIRERIGTIPGIIIEVVSVAEGPPIGKDIEIQLTSDNLSSLIEATRIVTEKFNTTAALFDIENTLPLPGIEWEVVVDQAEAGRLGLDVGSIGASIQFVTEGALIAQYRPLNAEEEVDIRVRYPATSRNLRELETLRIQSPQGALPLSSVVEVKPRPRQDQINRRDQQLVYEIKANVVEGFAINQQVEEVKNWLASEADLPDGVDFKFLGQEEENAAAGEFFQAAGLAIIFMIGTILLLQFNSFYHVCLTLGSVILSIVGVLLGLTFFPYISIILCGTGVITLVGIVVNNNIVLIDTYRRLTHQGGVEPVEAAIRTAAQRARPVVLTTITTVVGLMPLVLGWKANVFSGEFSTRGTSTSEIWQPISYVISCGLAFATILTLVLTPVLLAAPTVWMNKIRHITSKSQEVDRNGFTEELKSEWNPAE